jgi:2,4-dienoyl-CoA reductase-like NADH-dependent reductase (Old Yellow Enzyme family)
MAVLAKINLAEGVSGGASIDDAIVTAQALQAAGADMLVLSAGRNIESGWMIFGSNINMEEMAKVLSGSRLTSLMLKLSQLNAKKIVFKEMYLLDLARKLRAAVSVPLAYIGGVKSLANVHSALAEGFDAVVMARALIHDAQLVNKLQSGELTRSGCTSCNRCVAYIYHPAGTWCVENPPNELALNQQKASA